MCFAKTHGFTPLSGRVLLVVALALTSSSPSVAEDGNSGCTTRFDSVGPKNSDIGIALNVLDRDGDQDTDGRSQGFRFFEGTSLYYSLGGGDCVWKPVALLSALDFDDDVDLETGVAFGVMFEAGARNNGGRFTVSLTRGYNLMTDGDGNPWYTVVGFGWNFGRGGDG